LLTLTLLLLLLFFGPTFGPHQGCYNQHSTKCTKLSTTFIHIGVQRYISFLKNHQMCPTSFLGLPHLFISLHLLFKPCFESAYCPSIFNNAHVMLQTFFFLKKVLVVSLLLHNLFWTHNGLLFNMSIYSLQHTQHLFFRLLFVLDLFFFLFVSFTQVCSSWCTQ